MRLPHLRTVIASLGVLAVLALVAVLWTGHQSGLPGSRTTASRPPAAPKTGSPGAAVKTAHAAPDLEVMLPGTVDGIKLKKGSTIGSVVFGSDAFSRHMSRFLASKGKATSDLRFANAQDPSGSLDLETGVFQVPGVQASALEQAIVASSRPDAPGLTSSAATLSGKRVTTLVYPGGSNLYLYAHGNLVFYVGTQNGGLAARVLAMYP